MVSYAAHARRSKPRQGNMYATVGHNQKQKRGITRTPLRFGKLVGRRTAKRSVIRG
jgi:hypothetical protein